MDKKLLLALIPFAFFTLFFQPSSLLASRRIDSAEKLDYLNRATGGPSAGASSTFEARLNAVMDVTPTPERTYVGGEDALARQQAAANLKEEALVEAKRAEELNPARYNPKETADMTKIADASAAKDAKSNATEKSYLKDRADIQQDFEKRLEKEKQPASSPVSEQRSAAAKDTLRADLANNPFYTKKAALPESNSFELKRTLYVSRVSAVTGVSPEKATEIVGRAANTEDLILILMKEFGITYGEASIAIS